MIDRDKRANKHFASMIRDKRRQIFGPILLRFLRAAKMYRYVHRYMSKSYSSPITVVDDIYEGVIAIAFKEPEKSQMLWVFYQSAQEWYLTPYKIPPKARKVLEVFRRLSLPNQNGYMAIIAKRYTYGAQKKASELGVPVRTPKQVDEDIKKLFRARYFGFLARLRGKRVFGFLAAEIYVLQVLATEWIGKEVPTIFRDETDVIRCIESGCEIPTSIVGPPTVGKG